jgi:hypothetical protein
MATSSTSGYAASHARSRVNGLAPQADLAAIVHPKPSVGQPLPNAHAERIETDGAIRTAN